MYETEEERVRERLKWLKRVREQNEKNARKI